MNKDDTINVLEGEPNGTRLILCRNKYNEQGHLVLAEPIKEVVLCKDCKYYRHDNRYDDRYLNPSTCLRNGDLTYLNVEPNDYCSYGEVKDE